MNQLADLLSQWQRGDDLALAALVERLQAKQLRPYAELLRAKSGHAHLVQADDLITQGWQRMAALKDPSFSDIEGFLRFFKKMMRNGLIDTRRHFESKSRGHGLQQVDMEDLCI